MEASQDWVTWLICEDGPTRAAWEAEVARQGGRATGAPHIAVGHRVDDDLSPDVVIAAQPFELGDIGLGARAEDVGVVSVGYDVSGSMPSRPHVTLPADATPREAGLAAGLLAQIVRLKGDLRRGRRKRRKLLQLALRDSLTGLANRLAWEQELKRRCEAAGKGSELTIAILDVDYLKAINDKEGHSAGDEALRSFAAGLEARLRDDDFVARIGGDEFGVLLADVPFDRAGEIVDRIRRTASAPATNSADASRPALAASAGWAWIDKPIAPADAFQRADEALLLAKDRGRGRTFGAASDGVRGSGSAGDPGVRKRGRVGEGASGS